MTDFTLNNAAILRPPFSAVIPARNEAETVAHVTGLLQGSDLIDEIIVVDNGSTDATAVEALKGGDKVRVIHEPRPGLGMALRTGFAAARNPGVIKVDADLAKLDPRIPERLYAGIDGADVALVKGRWQDLKDPMPMTRLMLRPALKEFFPGLAHIEAPNTGLYLFNRDLVTVDRLVPSNAADIDLMLRVHTAGWRITEASIGEIDNNPRTTGHYDAMAENILGLIVDRHRARAGVPLAVHLPNATDAVLTSFGTALQRLELDGQVSFHVNDDDPAAPAIAEALRHHPTAHLRPLGATKNEHAAPDAMVTTAGMAGGSVGAGTALVAPTGLALEGPCDTMPDLRVDISAHVATKRELCETLVDVDALAAARLERHWGSETAWGRQSGVIQAEGFHGLAEGNAPVTASMPSGAPL